MSRHPDEWFEEEAMVKIDRTSGLPAYRQIADNLRQQIRSGKFAAGDQLPSERELVDEYGASRVTVRQAVALLRTEGLVVAQHGRGLFVRNRPRIQRFSQSRLSRRQRDRGAGAFISDGHTAQFTPRVETDIRVEDADERTATLLGIAVGDPVLVRERRMLADDEPVQLAVSRLPRALTAGTRIEDEDTGPGGSYARLEELGHRLEGFTERVTARMPTPEEAVALQLSTGTPVIETLRVARDTEGMAVEINDMLFAADRYEFIYELPAD